MKTIQEIENEIVEEFAVYDDWMDKYAYLIEIGNDLPGMDEAHKTEDNLIQGCQSRVWFHAEMKDGRLWFTADSDAIITKGIARQTPSSWIAFNLSMFSLKIRCSS